MRLALYVKPREYRNWLIQQAARDPDEQYCVGEVGPNTYTPLDNWLQELLGFFCTLEYQEEGQDPIHLRMMDSEAEHEIFLGVPNWLVPLYHMYTRTPRRENYIDWENRHFVHANSITALGALSDLEKFIKFPTRKRKSHGVAAA